MGMDDIGCIRLSACNGCVVDGPDVRDVANVTNVVGVTDSRDVANVTDVVGVTNIREVANASSGWRTN